ncbi:MAG: hypothetical protein AAGF07_01570 [Patescibacteria group bacterium]
MSWLNLTTEQAIQINETIDKYHDPYYWTVVAVVAFVFLIDSYLPRKRIFESKLDKILSYVKLITLIFLSLITLSQGLTGGCFIQIPQNWIAQNYLDRPYWYPYGLVFREMIPEKYWIVLRIFYFFGSIFVAYRTYLFWQKRVLSPSQEKLNYAK